METPGNDEPSPIGRPGPDGGSPAVPPAVPPTEPVPVVPAAAAATPPVPPPTPPTRPPSGAARTPGGDGPPPPSAHKAVDEVEQIFEGGLEGDWPARAADSIVNVVGAVRDRTTGPVTTIARGIVFGVFAGVLGIAVFVLLVIAAIRLLDEALPSGVWLAYLVLGVVFLIAGALVFRKRNQPAPAGNTTRP